MQTSGGSVSLLIHKIEERVEFDNFQDFKNWHLGSGSIVYQQFDEAIREIATEDYYKIMYEAYTSKKYKISYSTALMLLRKRNA